MLNFSDLKKWYDDFIKRNEGFTPKDFKVWYDRVEDAHKLSRKIIGSEMIVRAIKIPVSQKPLDIQENRPLIDKIKEIIPDFLPKYGYDDKIFEYPNIDSGNHNSERLSKKILSYAKSYEMSSRSIEKLVSNLGEAWGRCKTTEECVNITLSTTHQAFILLGHYGPDYDSCWRQGSDKTRHKYALAQSPETFIITIDKFDSKINKNLNLTRCCGFFTPNTINMMNYYFLPGFSEGNAIHCFDYISKELLGKPVRMVEGAVLCDGGVFHNPYGNWSFTTDPANRFINPQILTSNFLNIDIDRCENCSRKMTPEDSYIIDDKTVCHQCRDAARRCALSNKISFKPMDIFITEYGAIEYAMSNIVIGLPNCDKCGYKTQSVKVVDGANYCNRCSNNSCIECDGCSGTFESNELEFIESGVFCPECIVNIQDCDFIEN